MRIKLTPQRRDDTIMLSKVGKSLFINGEEFNFSKLKRGDTLPKRAIVSEWFMDDVENIDGVIVMTLILPNPANFSLEQAFPEDIVVVGDGIIQLPQPLPEIDEVIE